MALLEFNFAILVFYKFSFCGSNCPIYFITRTYILDAVGSSGILKAKQKLGVTFNFDKQDVIDFTKYSKMTMCRASEANS